MIVDESSGQLCQEAKLLSAVEVAETKEHKLLMRKREILYARIGCCLAVCALISLVVILAVVAIVVSKPPDISDGTPSGSPSVEPSIVQYTATTTGHLDLLADLTNYTSLNTIDKSGQNLSGPVPSELGNLTELTILKLGSTSLSGILPR